MHQVTMELWIADLNIPEWWCVPSFRTRPTRSPNVSSTCWRSFETAATLWDVMKVVQEKSGKSVENHCYNNYGIFLQFYGEIIFKQYFQWLNCFFPLRIGLIKSRFHYFKGPKLNISWFLDFWTRHQAPKPVIFIFGDTRIFKRNPEKHLTHVYTYFLELWESTFSKIFESHMCSFLFFEILSTSFCIIKCEDEDREMMKIG